MAPWLRGDPYMLAPLMVPVATFFQNGFSGTTFSWLSGLLLVALFLAALLLFPVRSRYRARQAAMLKHVREMEALSEAGRAIVESSHGLEELCELIAAESAKVIDTRTFQIGLF